jgi:very-short-patch-repair endonuclease
MNNKELDKEALTRLYLEELKSTLEIAKIYGLTASQISYRLKSYGIPTRTRKESILISYTKGRKVWNTGLTKETDASVANISKGRKAYLDNNPDAMAKLVEKQVRFTKEEWENRTEEEKEQFIDKRTEKLIIGRNKPEAIKKQTESMVKAHANNPELTQALNIGLQKLYTEHPEIKEDTIKKLNEGRNASWKSPEGREKRIKALLKTWQNPETKEKHVKATLKGNQVRPTNIEQTVIDVITEYNLPYKYVGNGEVIIEGKNPDFINVNGLKSVIEVYGRYWHQIEDEPERIEFFLRYGFRTLILWDREIENIPHEEIYQKILKFTEECMVEFRKIHQIETA